MFLGWLKTPILWIGPGKKMLLISNYYLLLDLSLIFEENSHEKDKHNEKWPQKMNEVGW